MYKSVKLNWINWLKANPDKQCKDKLQDYKGNYCVMGALYVANDLKIPANGRVANRESYTKSHTGMEYADISQSIPSQFLSLVSLNNAGYSFKTLIPLIEEYVPEEPDPVDLQSPPSLSEEPLPTEEKVLAYA